MKLIVTLSVITLLVPLDSHSTLHPVLLNPVISQCEQLGQQGECSFNVFYASSGTQLADVAELGPPNPMGGVWLSSIGVHCADGSALTHVPFSKCIFTPDRIHSPRMNTSCRLISTKSWELKNPESCTFTSKTWGGHGGAGPGGECVLIVQDAPSVAWTANMAFTIHGLLNPNVVANSGNTFCQKPLPPNVRCDIALPPTLDHGEINTNSHSVVSVDGTLDCGGQPKLTVMGGGKLHLGPGLSTVVTAQMDGASRVRVTSTLDAINAEIGEHSGAAIVLVSPY